MRLLHIDRLALRGFARSDAAAVSAGMRAELESLLAANPAVDALLAHRSSRVLRAGEVRVTPSATPAAVGRAAASRIVRGAKP